MSAARPLSRLWRPALVAGLLVVAAAGAVAGPNAWVAAAARGRSYTDVASVPARSVAIVPGSPVLRGQPGAQVRARLEAALSLYRSGRVKAILVSGNDTTASPEVGVMSAWLLARGIPAADVWTDAGGSRTRETMRRAAGLFGVTDAIVCTQDLFMARSLYLAQQAGIDAVGVDAAPQGVSARSARREVLKTTLAFVESQVREGPSALAAERARQSAIAAAR